MAEDGEVRIKTAIDNTGLEKDAKKTQGIIGKLTKSLAELGDGKISKGLASVGTAAGGMALAFNTARQAIGAVSSAISELTESYKAQEKAEIQLETAAKNNPYLSERAVGELKGYAGELQKIGTVGDETLLPMMAQLAASGRTQAEIQRIMKAALDASASGAISLESAVNGLNMSYSGQIGTLGRTLPMLKDLTAEELKSGKAVEVVAKAYKGMAEQVAKTTGTSEQLKNAVGDLKEELGAPFEKAMGPLRGFFTELVGGWTNALNARRKYNEAKEANSTGNATQSTLTTEIEELEKKRTEQLDYIARINKNISKAKENMKGFYEDERRQAVYELQGIETHIKVLKQERERLASIEYAARNDAEREKAAAEARKAEEEALAKASENYSAIIAKRDAEIERIKRTAEAMGEEADEQQILNAELNAYLEMAKDPLLPTRTEEQRKRVEGLAAAMGDLEKAMDLISGATAGLMEDAESLLGGDNEETLSSAIKAAIDNLKEQKALFEGNAEAAEKFAGKIRELEELLPKVEAAESQEAAAKRIAELQEAMDGARSGRQLSKIDELEKSKADLQARYDAAEVEREQLAADEKLRIQEGYKEAMADLERQITEAQEEENRRRVQNVSDMVSQVQDCVSQTVSIMKDASDLMMQTVQNQADSELATLEKQYLKGEMDEEEYEKKKIEAKRKAAKEEHKIQMFQWGASLLQATANIAQGITKAIAQGGTMGLVTGSLLAAAGAVQIASIIASKPTPPSFATGGIVPGNSYTGDNVRANVNSGEMILNATQQKALWAVANGRGANGNNGANITINNSASNIVRAEPRITKDKIEIMVDARVNESLKDGRYDQSLAMANQGMGGDFYGI